MAEQAGLSLSQYLLLKGLDGNLQELESQRREAEGPLINASLYQKLSQLHALLGKFGGLFNQRQKAINSALACGDPPPGDEGEIQEVIAKLEEVKEIVKQTGREISLHRLSVRAKRVQEVQQVK